MQVYVHVVGESEVKLWGLTSRERLHRQLARRKNSRLIDNLSAIPDDAAVVLLRGDYLFDARVLDGLLATSDLILETVSTGRRVAVAAHTSGARAAQVLTTVDGTAATISPEIRRVTVTDIATAYTSQQWLLKSSPPFVLPITADKQRTLENRLYTESYKSVTDLVTKWLWPKPARSAVRLCVRYYINPNQVTLTSLVLVVAVIGLFAKSHFGWGLTAAALMTFLDTVDGKLARVTVTSTRLGGLFDHGIDLIHPPLWYAAWGIGLSELNIGVLGLSVSDALWIMVAGYIAGRIAEGVFQWRVAEFSLFIWHPFDSYFRLVTARRNPNLLLLLASVTINRADLGLAAVSAWTLLSTLVLMLRVFQAWRRKARSTSLTPWFLEIGRDVNPNALAIRLFVRREG